MSDPKHAEPEGLLARWSARKARVREAEQELETQAREGVETPAGPPGAVDPSQPVVDSEPEGEPRKELTDADMPPIEALDERSDLSMFFSSKVSEELRRRALRKVFLSAAFNRVDGLDDYAEDFTSFEPLGDIVTSDIKHQLEMARERLAAAGQPLEDAGSEQIEGEAIAPEAAPQTAAAEPVESNDDDTTMDRDAARADAPDDAGGSRA